MMCRRTDVVLSGGDMSKIEKLEEIENRVEDGVYCTLPIDIYNVDRAY